MAKAPKNKDQEPEVSDEEGEGGKSKSSKLLLVAAVLLSLVSLGGGFFLARMAFQQDAAQYEPDYVEDVVEEATDEEGKAADDSEYEEETDTADGGDGEEGTETAATEGMLEFDEILTNITSFNAHGVPSNAFLKLSVVMVYRPDPGAADLMKKRQPFMRDLFNGYARSLTEADVRGMAGILTVKAELLKRARAAAGNDLPQEILISDLIVQ
jgi:flagellar basal body-associated protein FliL